mmetsp:Transcript_73714/g.85622  ORF Transcript_73714/g.85622 Transcript_73714/m.85622 type:complete len:141 (-) Transcript_73714:188-610(-)
MSSSGPQHTQVPPSTGGGETWKSSFTGWRFKRDRNRFLIAVSSCCICYVGVLFTEWKERNRRHSSIQKDIEREQWRAAQLGLDAPQKPTGDQASNGASVVVGDDGFAQKYIEQLKSSGSYIENVAATFITTKTAASAKSS